MTRRSSTGEPRRSSPVRLPGAEAYWPAGERPPTAAREAELADEAARAGRRLDCRRVAAWLRLAPATARPPPRWRGDELAEPCQHAASTATGRRRGLRSAGGPDLGCPLRGRAGPGWPRREAARCGQALSALHRARRVRRRPADPAGAARARRRSTPGRPQVRDRRDPLGLTRRETRGPRGDLRRAEQAPAIAAKLFVSATTVDHHVSAVLANGCGAPTERTFGPPRQTYVVGPYTIMTWHANLLTRLGRHRG